MTTALETIIGRKLEELTGAEQIVVEHVTTGDEIPGDRLAFLATLGIEGDKLESEKRRIRTVRQWQSQAGTRAEREQLDSDLADARAELGREAPALEAVIAEAQQKLTELRRRVTRTEADVERRAAAVEKLREPELLPLWAREQYSAQKRQFNAGIRHEFETRRARRASIAAILAYDAAQVHSHVVGNQSLWHMLDDRSRLRPGVWEQFCRELRDESERLDAELAELAPAFESGKAELSALLDHHLI